MSILHLLLYCSFLSFLSEKASSIFGISSSLFLFWIIAREPVATMMLEWANGMMPSGQLQVFFPRKLYLLQVDRIYVLMGHAVYADNYSCYFFQARKKAYVAFYDIVFHLHQVLMLTRWLMLARSFPFVLAVAGLQFSLEWGTLKYVCSARVSQTSNCCMVQMTS